MTARRAALISVLAAVVLLAFLLAVTALLCSTVPGYANSQATHGAGEWYLQLTAMAGEGAAFPTPGP